MNSNYLDFEQPIAELEERIDSLHEIGASDEVDVDDEIAQLKEKSVKLTEKVYANLSPWDVVKVARHPLRPHTSDYIPYLLDDFDELHGDRHFADDRSIIGGLGRLNQWCVVLIGQEKGRTTQERVERNFGMPRPEGYRKAMRLMHLAERFGLPVLTLIDTPGAYPGVESEERNISEAIARNLAVMSQLRVPALCAVIGEGSSGGALGIGVGDHLCMLQYATYFVISPEGCANIIWKSADKAPLAAEAMGLTSDTLLEFKLVDSIIPEPLGGAHRDLERMAGLLREHIGERIDELMAMSIPDMLERRYQRLMAYGAPP